MVKFRRENKFTLSISIQTFWRLKLFRYKRNIYTRDETFSALQDTYWQRKSTKWCGVGWVAVAKVGEIYPAGGSWGRAFRENHRATDARDRRGRCQSRGPTMGLAGVERRARESTSHLSTGRPPPGGCGRGVWKLRSSLRQEKIG